MLSLKLLSSTQLGALVPEELRDTVCSALEEEPGSLVATLSFLDRSLLVSSFPFVAVQLLSHVRPFSTLWTAARQASLSITNSWSLLRLMSIESVMPSNRLILCRPLLLLPSIFPSIPLFPRLITD